MEEVLLFIVGLAVFGFVVAFIYGLSGTRPSSLENSLKIGLIGLGAGLAIAFQLFIRFALPIIIVLFLLKACFG